MGLSTDWQGVDITNSLREQMCSVILHSRNMQVFLFYFFKVEVAPCPTPYYTSNILLSNE